jgi:hypothetical protein
VDKLHNEELGDLYFSLNTVQVIKSSKMRWVGMEHTWGRRDVYTGFWWGNLRDRDHSEDTRRRWEDNIKMDIRDVRRGGMDWIYMAQDKDMWRAPVNAVTNLQVP